MTTLYPLLILSFLLIFIGMFTHWSIVLFGALLPLFPFVMILLRRKSRNSD